MKRDTSKGTSSDTPPSAEVPSDTPFYESAHLELDALRAMLGTSTTLEERNVPPQDDEEDPG